jgi:hypothetical protein
MTKTAHCQPRSIIEARCSVKDTPPSGCSRSSSDVSYHREKVVLSDDERQRRAENMRMINARKPPKDEAYYREFVKARVFIDENGCWLWQRFVGPPPNPYGQCYALKRNWRVHRLAYLLWKGPLDPTLDICHTCDVKRCCNPDHLWQGTPKENMTDAAAKRIWSRQHQTHCRNGHEFTQENIYRSPGRPNKRQCKECQRERGRRNWRERPEFMRERVRRSRLRQKEKLAGHQL